MCLFIFWYNPSPLVYTGRCQLNSGDRFPHSGHLPGVLLKTKGLWAQNTIFSRMIILQIQNFDQIIKHTAISNFLDCELFDVRLSKTTSILPATTAMDIIFSAVLIITWIFSCGANIWPHFRLSERGHKFEGSPFHILNGLIQCRGVAKHCIVWNRVNALTLF